MKTPAVLWWESSAPASTAPGGPSARFAARAWREPRATRMHRRTYRCHFRWWKHRSLEPAKFPRSWGDPSGCHVQNDVAKHTHTHKHTNTHKIKHWNCNFFLYMNAWGFFNSCTTTMSQLAVILELLLAGQFWNHEPSTRQNVFQWKKSQGSAMNRSGEVFRKSELTLWTKHAKVPTCKASIYFKLCTCHSVLSRKTSEHFDGRVVPMPSVINETRKRSARNQMSLIT